MNEFAKHMIKTGRITKIVEEAPNIKTFELSIAMHAEPGQFVMAFLPQVGERPFALTQAGKKIAITVKKRGSFTEKLFSLKEGSFLGIRGPYGKGFSLQNVGKACLVAAGIGIAALIRLAEELAKEGASVTLVFACKSANEIIFKERLEKVASLHIATEDGSAGFKGDCIELLEKVLKKQSYDKLYCCGPEAMMVSVLKLCEKYEIDAEFAVERYMKCAVGLCGHCCLDEWLVCTDGPVFSKEQLLASKEFGRIYYSKSGKRMRFGGD